MSLSPEFTPEHAWHLAWMWAMHTADKALDEGLITEREAGQLFGVRLLTTYHQSLTMRGIEPTWGHPPIVEFKP